MTPQPQTDTTAGFAPDSQDRRRNRRADDDKPAWWKIIKPSDLVAIGMLVSMIMSSLSLMGFHRESPASAIAAEILNRAKADTVITKTVDSLGRRLERSDSTVKTLTDRLVFTNYMQCQQAKASGSVIPEWATARCDSIIQRRLAP